eukprot:symbB.v1.2.001500.t1/scaffold82.1/size400680/10
MFVQSTDTFWGHWKHNITNRFSPADSATAGWAELENGFAVLQAERDALKKEVNDLRQQCMDQNIKDDFEGASQSCAVTLKIQLDPAMSMEVKLRNVWKGFQYDRIEGNLEVFESDGLVLISGCVTTTSPFGSKAGFDTRLDYHPLMLQYRPRRERAYFLAPIAVSRYEGIRQCAASAWVNNEGFLYMHYHKNAMPMVVHFSGFAFCSNDEEDAYELQSIQKLKIDEVDPPRAQRCGDLVMLQGCFQESKLGSSEKVAVLPKDLRPKREVRS